MSASETVYSISKTEYETPAQKNKQIMTADNVSKTQAASFLSKKKKERIHTSNSIQNLYKPLQKLTSFYFTCNIIRELAQKLFQLSRQKMMRCFAQRAADCILHI